MQARKILQYTTYYMSIEFTAYNLPSSLHSKPQTPIGVTGWLSGYRALDRRSKGRGFETCQEHKKNFEFFWVKKAVLTRCRCATPVCIRTHTKDHVRTLKIL